MIFQTDSHGVVVSLALCVALALPCNAAPYFALLFHALPIRALPRG